MSSGKGTEGDLWDDSLLIKAFNDSISKYKKMHNLEQSISSGPAEEASSCKEDIPDLVDDVHGAERTPETYNEGIIIANGMTEMGDTRNKSTVKETSCLEPEVPENHLNSANVQDVQQNPSVHPDSQGQEDYNQLLQKYYELEDQRQKILQQLGQFGYGSYNFDYGTVTSEQHQTSTSQAYWGLSSSHCPYGCQSWTTPCTSGPSCCFNTACSRECCYAPAKAACLKDSVSHEDIDIVKTAKAAAERALSSLKEQVSDNSDVRASEGKKQQLEIHDGSLAKTTSSETDLAEVLNAWYSAGFYTGKYLSEQSLAKK